MKQTERDLTLPVCFLILERYEQTFPFNRSTFKSRSKYGSLERESSYLM
jgi:hypothetical protein